MNAQELEQWKVDHRPRCEHGSVRARDKFEAYAGPIYRCSCCRSRFGSLERGVKPTLCLECR